MAAVGRAFEMARSWSARDAVRPAAPMTNSARTVSTPPSACTSSTTTASCIRSRPSSPSRLARPRRRATRDGSREFAGSHTAASCTGTRSGSRCRRELIARSSDMSGPYRRERRTCSEASRKGASRPTDSRISSVPGWIAVARASRCGRTLRSTSRALTPWRASSAAANNPEGPAPMITTSWLVTFGRLADGWASAGPRMLTDYGARPSLRPGRDFPSVK